MKYITLLYLLISAGTALSQNIWLQKDSVNGAPRSAASAFVLLGEAYTIAGLDIDGFRRKMYSYSYFQDDWDNELSLGGQNGDGNERGSACAFSLMNKGYVCLGQGVTNGFFGDLWEYDPGSQSWSQKADFAGSPRRQACSFTINEEAYVGTGSDANGLCNDFYKYDPTSNTWSQISDFGGSARREAVGFSMGADGYVGTGDDGVKRNDFWRYLVDTDSWIQLSDFPGTPRKGAVGWGDFPQAFICCGEDINDQFMNDLWEYNFYSDAWVQRASLPGPGRTNPIVFQLNGFAFVGTGYNGAFLDDLWAYQRILKTDTQELEQVTLFPNPAVQSFSCSGVQQGCIWKIIDDKGRDVSDHFQVQNKGNEIQFLSLSPISGVYHIQLLDGLNNTFTSKKIILL